MGYKNFPFMSMYEGGASEALHPSKKQPLCYVDYDPTNGTVSLGDVYRFGGSYQTGHWMRNGVEIGTSPSGACW